MDRRQLIRGIGAAICAGVVPRFIPSLLSEPLGVSVGVLRGSHGALQEFSKIDSAWIPTHVAKFYYEEYDLGHIIGNMGA